MGSSNCNDLRACRFSAGPFVLFKETKSLEAVRKGSFFLCPHYISKRVKY